jgi:FOG: HPt domain
MNQVGGDREFLDEVIQDLLNEATAAEREIGDAIRARDYATVMKAAHRVKGSASYLCCDELMKVSKELQDAGHDATKPGAKDLHEPIEDLFRDYKKALDELKREVAPRK